MMRACAYSHHGATAFVTYLLRHALRMNLEGVVAKPSVNEQMAGNVDAIVASGPDDRSTRAS